ncbi:hypothetical protein L3X38_033515 [Prunus dulcis]|uniref:F-box domain-containing protein n=1 Tax=Prunus dulcis TaxID=3755 RepID=A0AAD4YW02_PRUDU|nr:hypothetical protein L3X38_033515 [Prunus dulcis]
MDPHNEKDTDQVSSTFSNMPTDTIAIILGRLPLEPLVKSRLVCREWQWVSSRKDFIEDYDKRLNLGGPPTFHCLVTASTKDLRDVGCYSALLDPERSRGDPITDALVSSFHHIPADSTFESTRPKTAALVSRFYHQIPEDSKFKSNVWFPSNRQPAIAFLPNEMQDRYSRLRSLSRYVPSIIPIPSKWKFSYRQSKSMSQIASYHRNSNAAGNEYGR